MAEGWAREEVEALVTDYFQMLDDELCGRPYNKAAHRAQLAQFLASRSAPSIEFKHANVSAILIELGFPFITGYKPRSNYQLLLRDVVIDRLNATPGLIASVESSIASPVAPTFDDVLGALQSPPTRRETRERRAEIGYQARPNPFQVNYLEREAHNRELGRLGEEFVVVYEQARLAHIGQDRLAAAVEHVAHTRGDGLGYDVLSFDASGRERLIEVKTTRFGMDTPFFLSRNEVTVSERESDHYQLYRVFEFRERPKLFTLPGNLRHTCALVPESYVGRVA